MVHADEPPPAEVHRLLDAVAAELLLWLLALVLAGGLCLLLVHVNSHAGVI